MSNKHDPVEAAKLQRQTKVKVTTVPQPGAPVEEPLLPEEPKPEPPTPQPPVQQPQVIPVRGVGFEGGHQRYRVARTKSFSWGGAMTQLQAGAVVEASNYGGESGLRRLAEQGVELVPLP